MALEEYRRKRDFKKTPEPPPRKIKPHKKKLSYLIQKHDATRLHYDFRLELDGVLLSWAVTRGPSLNPADKRLAVRTEDHPLSYGSFEGTIPKGQYGGGTVMLWDEGSWEPVGDPRAGLKKGHLSFILKGHRLKGRWDLIRMRFEGKRENWLLIKEKDEESRANVKSEKFLGDLSFSVKTGRSMGEIAKGNKVWNSKTKKSGSSIARLMKLYPHVELATLVDKPPEGERWLHEIKFDGYRLLGFVSNGETRLRTRNGNDWTEKFPAIAAELEHLGPEAVIDMEAVILNDAGKTSFQALKNALGEAGDANAITAFAFDLLHLDGKDVSKLPLLERKKKLNALLGKSKIIRYSDHIPGHGADMISKSCHMGLEGIVSKRADTPYRAGRQKDWLKSKCGMRQEFIILGYSDPRKGERAFGALYLGYRKNGRVKYAGKVGTGFTMQIARDLVNALEKLELKKPAMTRTAMSPLLPGEWARIHWVRPKLLCEVAFTEWTEDGHLRHPSFQGLREDKPAREVKREKPMAVKKATKAAQKITRDLILHGVIITHPDRIIDKSGITKGDLAEYYAAVAPLMLPLIKERPLTLLRCPGGLNDECFYQRNPGKGLGPDVRPFHFRHKGKKYEYLYIEDAKGLMELIQMGCIEIHPWGATVKRIDYPTQIIFDLDPAPGVPFEAVKLAAQDLRARLKKKKLDPYLKCTGGKGLHIIAPLKKKTKWPEAKEFAADLAHEMVEAAPEAYVATMTKAKRTGKIFIDFFRNDYTATAIADYAVRARPGMPVALPIEWRELGEIKSPAQFSMKDVLKRLKK